MPEPKYTVVPVERKPLQRDPQKEQYDWFGELVRDLGPGHEFDPAAQLLISHVNRREA